ncbi:MAG: PASTA domain-containing protein [Chlorobi bacterium]|nr:PASTA domain-containing protein [Chlorobiota bacterium]
MNSLFRRIFKRHSSQYTLLAIIGLIVSIAIFDQFIMPLMVHSRSTITMPNVIGMPTERAISLLQKHGLSVREIREQYDTTQPAGRVVLQSPYSGAAVREGRRVYLVASRGDEIVRMPELSGMSIRDAQLLLLRNGLQLGDVRTISCDSASIVGIITQQPPAGVNVRVGTSVIVTVCRDTIALVEVPNLLYRGRDEAIEMLVRANLLLGEVVLTHDETFTSGTVLRQEPPAGARVPAQSIVRLWVASSY